MCLTSLLQKLEAARNILVENKAEGQEAQQLCAAGAASGCSNDESGSGDLSLPHVC